MPQNSVLFTTGQFARLHRLNKRTLQYYDDIGLFSPACKGSNEYRYYTCAQVAELENILALRELNVPIKEIKQYLEHPDPPGFLALSGRRLEEIELEISRLKKLEKILQKKREQLSLCTEVSDGQISLIQRPEEHLLLTALDPKRKPADEKESDMDILIRHLQSAWDLSGCKAGCGSYISTQKIRQGQFDRYDGLFTQIEGPADIDGYYLKPAGSFLQGFSVGAWDKLPDMYGKMLGFAREKHLELYGFACETGLNEVAISDMSEYVTQILIPARPL